MVDLRQWAVRRAAARTTARATARTAARAGALGLAAATTAVLATALSAGSVQVPAAAASTEGLRLNQIQVIGTHNSYHVEPNDKEWSVISTMAEPQARGLQYSHAPLGQQFSGQNVRQIELDVYADPDGGRFARPLIRVLTGQTPDYDARMKEKGTKVLHISDLDYHSTCVSFVQCLTEVRGWSRANPAHVPLSILVEFKDTIDIPVPNGPSIPLVTWTRERMLGLEQEIRSVFSAGDLITPDDVRADGLTLEQSVLRDGWPTLESARGKVMFVMDNDGVYRDRYVQDNPSLQGRILFTNSSPGQPDAAFIKRNDAV